MTTLAQHFLEHRSKPSKWDQTVIDCLKLEHTTATEYARYADRIVFDENLNEVYHEMVDAEQLSPEMIFRNVKMPSSHLWIEWRVETAQNIRMQLGCLLVKTDRPELPVDMSVITRSDQHGGCGLVARFKIDEPPYLDVASLNGRPFKMTWSDADGRFIDKDGPGSRAFDDPNDPRWGQLMNTVMKGAFFGMFLLQQPKVVEDVPVTHASKLNAKRAKRGKPPLLDYRRIYMKFGVLGSRVGIIKKARHGVAGDGAGGGKKKYHHVLGHFRCYYRDTPQEHVIWIAEHWRGDPALGVSLKERNLTQRKGS
jgi:hypothetical protein